MCWRLLLSFSLSLLLMTLLACTHSPVQEAAILAHIHTSDSLETKIEKTLALLNDRRYFQPKQSVSLKPPLDDSYNLDSLRKPDEILSQKIGGASGSAALAFAAILTESGVDSKDLQIVSTVVNDDLRLVCPRPGKARVLRPKTEASGFVFVAVQTSTGKWQLINPMEGSAHYAKSSWMDPSTLKQRMAQESVQIPRDAFRRLPFKTFESGLSVIQTWNLEDVPSHSSEQKLDLIASGRIDQPASVCRFTAPPANSSP